MRSAETNVVALNTSTYRA